jgi:hypothetical protein
LRIENVGETEKRASRRASQFSILNPQFGQSRFTRPLLPLSLLPLLRPEDELPLLLLPLLPLLLLRPLSRDAEDPLPLLLRPLSRETELPLLRSRLPLLLPLPLPLRVLEPRSLLPLSEPEPREMRGPPMPSMTRREGADAPLLVDVDEPLPPEGAAGSLPAPLRTRLRHDSFRDERSLDPSDGVEVPVDGVTPGVSSRPRLRQPGEDGVSAGGLPRSVSRPRSIPRPVDPEEEPGSTGCVLTGGFPRLIPPLEPPLLRPSMGDTLPRPIGATLPPPMGATDPPPTVREGPLDVEPEPRAARITRSRTVPPTSPSRRK